MAMKKTILILTTALFATLTSCVTGDDYNAPDLSGECVTKTADIDIVPVVNNATTTPTLWDLANGTILEAYVTSSDEGGNFYKTISMVAYDDNDNEYGFTVPVDEYNLFNVYEPGRKVYIDLTGLYVMEDDYTDDLQIGQLFGNDIGRIALDKYKTKIFRSCDKMDEEDLVNHIELSEARNLENLHTLVEFDNVQFDDASLGTTFFNPNNTAGSGTNHTIKDKFGNNILLRISEFATFAGEAIPSGNGKIRGVLTKFGSDYQLMIRTINDVKLTNERYVPNLLFEETFVNNFPTWTAYSVVGAQVWTSTNFGNPTPSAYMNGFSSGSQANEDWLISPAIDLTSNVFAALTFETSTRFAGPALQVYISTNYSGSGAPSAATWTELTGFNLPVWTSGSYTSWSAGASGGIDISNYVGNSNVRVAFKYTSTTAAAAGWEVDNVRVIGQ
ncbi:MAG: hypothetical protein CMP76_05235 [Flavobacterium sp.]|nr:hypothetical protein [Flavobacterium sp.]